MLYNVAQLLKEPAGATREYSLDESVTLGEEEDWGEIAVKGRMNVLRTPTGLLVTGEVQTAINEECARCLESYDQALTLEIEDEFIPQVDPTTGMTVGVPEGQFGIDGHHLLDLSEALRQAILLNRPIQPLCRPDCRGLCPDCGGNRNLRQCECAGAPVDPRWAKLKTMLS